MKRLKMDMKKLRTFLGPIVREMERKSGEFAIPCVHWLIAKMCLVSELKLAKHVMVQERTSKNKAYSAYALEVECISKDKAHKRCEFGVKVGVDVTNRSRFVESGLAFQSNPYYGHSMAIQLIQVERVTGEKLEEVFVERGYCGHGMAELRDFISGQKRSVNARLRCAGLNMRIILKMIRTFCADLWQRLTVCIRSEKPISFLAFQGRRPYARNLPETGLFRVDEFGLDACKFTVANHTIQ